MKKTSEETLKKLSSMILWFGVIIGIILIIAGILNDNDGGPFVIGGLACIVVFITQSVFLKVISNISQNLFEINSKLKD